MYLNYFTTQDKLDTVLRDGLPFRGKWTGGIRKPNSIWLTKHANLSVPSSEDLKFIANLQPDPGRWPPNYAVSEPDIDFDRGVRVRVRVRSEQMTPWLWWAVNSYETSYANRVAIREFEDGWLMMRQPITPNQITRVDEWSADENEWRKLRLVRRLERPAAGQFASLHCRQPSLSVPGTSSASTMVGWRIRP